MILQKTSADGGSGGSRIRLTRAQGGHPIQVVTQASADHADSETSGQVTAETMAVLQRNLSLSTRQTIEAGKIIRRQEAGGISVESNFQRKLQERGRQLSSFFEVRKIEFDGSCAGQREVRDVVFCNGVADLVAEVAERRQIQNPQCKVGIDGGGGFIRVCLTVTEAEQVTPQPSPVKWIPPSAGNKYTDGGVKKIFLLAIVESVRENYNNLLAITQPLTLHSMNYTIAANLKVANLLCGLQSHASSHPCCWCEAGPPFTTPASLRTIGSISQQAQGFASDGSRSSTARHYCNSIHAPLLVAPDDTPILDLIAPPELHLMMGCTTKILGVINNRWGEDRAYKWAEQQGIRRADYRGGTLEGNQCRAVLKNAGLLTEALPRNLKPLGHLLIKFNAIVKACFGMELDAGFAKALHDFKEAFTSSGIPITPKVHAVFDHVPQFIQKTGQSLGQFSEQASESVHADFNKEWCHFKLPRQHQRYAEALLRAVVRYNSLHL